MTDLQTQDPPLTAGSSRGSLGDFIWYELMTTDSEGAKQFYGPVIGWKFGDPAPGGPVEYRMIVRDDGGNAGGVLTITDDMAQHGAKPVWLGYIHVDNVDAALAAIEQAGGKVLMPKSEAAGVGPIAMVSDPQGAPFYIMTPIPPADQPNAKSDVFSEREVQRCGWNELSTTDEAGARRFYGEQFGWNTEDFMSMGEMGDYRFIDHDGQRLGALFNTPDGHPRWRFYFRVASISESKMAIEENGGSVLMGPHQVPTGDWIIVAKDPQGAEFALVGGE